MAHNTASRGYRGGERVEDSPPVSRPLNMAHNTLPQVFARMGLLPHVEQTFYVEFEGNLAYNGASPALQPRENSSYNA